MNQNILGRTSGWSRPLLLSRLLLVVKYGVGAGQKHVPTRPLAGRIGSSSGALGVTRAERVGPDYYDVKEVYFHEKHPQFGNSLFGAQLL